MNEYAFEITPIKVNRGSYSASAHLYNAINATKNNISGIFIFNQCLKKEELEDIKLQNWMLGKFMNGRYKLRSGEIFDENSCCLAVAGEDSDSLIKIAEKLCVKLEQKTVLVKDCNASEMFLVSINKKSLTHNDLKH